jgi:hypothetical protein
MAQFEPTDIVMMRRGGPLMTVTEVEPLGTPRPSSMDRLFASLDRLETILKELAAVRDEIA